ncbi:hypothetical protein [Streptomyces sp. NPDC001436]
MALLLILAVLLPLAVAVEDDGLEDLAWSPLAQTVHAAGITGVMLAALPFLSGTASGGGALGIGAACVGLCALYVVMPIWALMN